MTATPERHLTVVNMLTPRKKLTYIAIIARRPPWNPRAEREKEKLEMLAPILAQTARRRSTGTKMRPVKSREMT